MPNFYIIGDIGNTDIKICVYKNKNILKKIRLSTNKVNLKYLRKNLNVLRKYDKKLKQILFCSVVPNCYKKIKNYFKLYFNTIAPGINLSLENLSKKAFLIPNVKFKKSNNVVGKNTISAINSGFFFGYSGLIDNIIHSIIKQTKKKYKIIFTGGLAKMFKNSLKLRVKIKSNLTTDGVLKAAMYLNK